MSDKNAKDITAQPNKVLESQFTTVKKDMITTVIVNLLFLGLLLGLYYWNQNAGQPLDHWIKDLIKL